MPAERDGQLFLGAEVDPSTHQRVDDSLIRYDSSNLTTHGVIVGMTGSGKTGLGVVMVEEAILQGIPTLVIDPKGDMGNLALTFPQLEAQDFAPWVDPSGAERDGQSVDGAAAATAAAWKSGLAGWGLESADIQALKDAADVTIYTPGSTAGVGLNVIGSFRCPESNDLETIADEVESLTTSILGLIGIEADPLASREHILLSNLLSRAWANGDDLTLAEIIGQVQHPPMRKLGVIDLDSFFPPSDRMQLAMKLNGLAASPAFAGWTRGEELDIARLLYSADGSPRCAVISISHLSDEERQFVVALILSKLITWMRAQPGTEVLRAMVYMDEVFGFVPPSAMPPAKKPILTILKQARAYGVGMVLSTQNPVDLDYKAISNAGTWMVGRLQTERDKGRLLEGMTSASGAVDIAEVDTALSGLGKREFLLHSTKKERPVVFGTRWAMSYLAGPLTRDQITALMADKKATLDARLAGAPEQQTTEGHVEAKTLEEDETNTPPTVAEGVEVAYLDPATPWLDQVGASALPTRLEPGLAARVHMLFDDTKADLRHEEEWEAVLFPIDGEQADMGAAIDVDYDDRDLVQDQPEGATYVLGPAKIHTKTFFANAKRDLRDRLYRGETLDLFQNVPLKAYSRPGETRAEFLDRCRNLAEDRADQDVAKIRASLEKKIDRIQSSIATAEDRLREAESRAQTSRDDELLSGVGDVLGGLLGGKKSSKSILGGLRRASSKRKTRQSADERVRTAENRVAEKIDQLEDLEDELADTIQDIVDDWDAKASEVTEFSVPLEKTDIAVEDVTLVWMASSQAK